MSMGETIGAANVRVLPNTKDFVPSLERFLKRIERQKSLAIKLIPDSDRLKEQVQQAVASAKQAVQAVEIPVKVDAERESLRVKVDVDPGSSTAAARALSRSVEDAKDALERLNRAAATAALSVGAFGSAVLRTATMAGAASVFATGVAPAIAATATAAVQAATPIAALAVALAPGTIVGAGAAFGALKLALTGVGSALSIESWEKFNEYMAFMDPAVRQALVPLFAMKQQMLDFQNVAQNAFFSPLDNLGKLEVFISPLRETIRGMAEAFGYASSMLVNFVTTSTGVSVVNDLLSNACQ